MCAILVYAEHLTITTAGRVVRADDRIRCAIAGDGNAVVDVEVAQCCGVVAAGDRQGEGAVNIEHDHVSSSGGVGVDHSSS